MGQLSFRHRHGLPPLNPRRGGSRPGKQPKKAGGTALAGSRSSRSGHSVIELGAMAVCIVVMALLCADVGIMVIASSINDRACRDAARAAAQMGDASSAQNAASASLRLCRVDGYFITPPTMSASDFAYEDYGGDPTPPASPFVSVTTSIVARIPAPIFFFGARFGEGGTMTFTRTYTFPIVKTTINLS